MLSRILIGLMLLLVPVLALADTVQLAPPTPDQVQAVQKQGRYLATITLENGKTIELVLEGAFMPYTVANFVNLAKAKYYDGLDFFRADYPKMPDGRQVGAALGGDPSGGGPGYTIRLEMNPNMLVHDNVVISMYRVSALDCSGSQFIITTGKLPMFDGALPIFGWAKSGKDVLAQIKPGDRMKSVMVAPYEGNEPCPVLTPAPDTAAHQPPTQADIDAVRKQGRYLATITMENGKVIKLVLEGKEAPITVANFVKLAQEKYYDGLLFHRVETGEGFQLIQGGDPAGNGSGGPGYQIRAEKNTLLHKKGALGMARSDNPDSAGSQFYIVRCDIQQLDGKYVVFGWLKDGMAVVDTVKKDDKMKLVTIAPYNGTEACPMIPTVEKK